MSQEINDEEKYLLLSICIPTFNRSNILDKTLSNLLKDPDFDPNIIEIIVSDNFSTDNTKEVVKKYPTVRYYCNEKNILDQNFTQVLSYAKGEYIRLFNDTLQLNNGKLKKMINIIEKNLNNNNNLLFYNNTGIYLNTKKNIYSQSDLLKYASLWSTWIGNFGCWRKDFSKINNPNNYAKSQLLQVDWIYTIVKEYSHTIIYFDNFNNTISVKNKGGYNIFNIFLNNYLSIIKKKKISLFDYEREKYRLCRYFLYSWIYDLLLQKKEKHSFNTNYAFKIIISNYWYEPYFYFMCIILYCKKSFNL